MTLTPHHGACGRIVYNVAMTALARPSADTSAGPRPRRLSRYELHGKIAAGGMATVHLGSVVGAAGFSRTVAIKRLHPHMADEPEFVAMFLDEATLAARIRHPNVVSTLDVVQEGEELFLIMEYVDGESLSELTRSLRDRGERTPLPVASGIIAGLLRGLHAAHEACGSDGKPLKIVHRDVSPQNVLVGADGVSRVVDFGIALANVRRQTTQQGQFKGKLAYTAPELLAARGPASVASDVYAAGLVLWEICAGRRAFQAESEEQLLVRVVSAQLPRLDEIAPWLPFDLIETIERAIARKPEDRYGSALEMALALEQAIVPAPAQEVSAFVESFASAKLAQRRAMQREVETSTGKENDTPSTVSGVAMVRSLPIGKHFEETFPGEMHDGTTVVEPATMSSPSRRRLIAMGVGIFALGWVAFGARSRIGTPPAVVEASTATPPAIREPTADPPASVGAASASAAPSLSPSSVTSPSASAPKEVRLTRQAPRPTTHAPVKTEKVAAPNAKQCDPPYTFDDQGIRRVKRECFGH